MPLTINGTDVSSVGFHLSAAPGWLDLPGRQLNAIQLQIGSVLTQQPIEQPKKLVLEGFIDAVTAAAARSSIDALRAIILASQPATITLPDQSTKYLRGYVDLHSIDPGNGPSMIQRTLRQKISFTCLDPFSYETTEQTLAVDGGVNRLPLGNAPSYPLITLSGALANPVLSLQKYDGTVIQTMTLNITSGGGDVLVIDSAHMTIAKNGVSVIDALTAGNFLVLDPALEQNGIGATGADQAYITSSSGSGSVVYRRTWR